VFINSHPVYMWGIYKNKPKDAEKLTAAIFGCNEILIMLILV
jgi:hypothetical protein